MSAEDWLGWDAIHVPDFDRDGDDPLEWGWDDWVPLSKTCKRCGQPYLYWRFIGRWVLFDGSEQPHVCKRDKDTFERFDCFCGMNPGVAVDETGEWWCVKCIEKWERENGYRWEDGGDLK